MITEEKLIVQAKETYGKLFKLRKTQEKYDLINLGNCIRFLDGLPKDMAVDERLLCNPALERLTIDTDFSGFGKIKIEVEHLPDCQKIIIDEYSIEPVVVYYVWFGKSNIAVFAQMLIINESDMTAWFPDLMIVNSAQSARVRWRMTLTQGLPRVLNMLDEGIQYLMSHRPEVLVEKPLSSKKHQKSNSSNPAEDYREVKVQSVFSIDLTQKPKTSTREYSCPCWGVSGHVRHYKSGKEIWIKPYRKGVDRDKPEAYSPKEYKLST